MSYCGCVWRLNDYLSDCLIASLQLYCNFIDVGLFLGCSKRLCPVETLNKQFFHCFSIGSVVENLWTNFLTIGQQAKTMALTASPRIFLKTSSINCLLSLNEEGFRILQLILGFSFSTLEIQRWGFVEIELYMAKIIMLFVPLPVNDVWFCDKFDTQYYYYFCQDP